MAAFPLLSDPRRVWPWALLAAGLLLGAAASARAQTQEGGTLDRILHPDRTLAFDGGNKAFTTSSTVGSKQASVKTFAFSKAATLKAGDGAFSTKAFASEGHFQTDAFSTRPAASVQKGFAQKDTLFATKTMAVKEDAAANKTLAVHEYAPFERAYLGRGRRQDTIDDLRKKKNLSIDEVRELLNKNK